MYDENILKRKERFCDEKNIDSIVFLVEWRYGGYCKIVILLAVFWAAGAEEG